MLTRGTSVVIDIHNTSLARPSQIEYPAVLKKTERFWGAKCNPSPSPLGPRNGSKGGKTGGRRAAWGVMTLPGFHIRFVCGCGGCLGGSWATGLELRRPGHARSFPPLWKLQLRSASATSEPTLINHRLRLRWVQAFWEINCGLKLE